MKSVLTSSFVALRAPDAGVRGYTTSLAA